MVLSKKSWYSRFYFFIESWWAYSKGEKWDAREFEQGRVSGSDICTFMRAFILKLPILVGVHALMFALLYVAFFQFPISHLGLTSYFTSVIMICGIIGICMGAWYGEKKVSTYFRNFDSNTKPAKTEPTFLDIFIAWIKGHHDNICLIMRFEDEETEDVQSD